MKRLSALVLVLLLAVPSGASPVPPDPLGEHGVYARIVREHGFIRLEVAPHGEWKSVTYEGVMISLGRPDSSVWMWVAPR